MSARYQLICVLLFGVGLVSWGLLTWLLAGRRIVNLLDRVTLARVVAPSVDHLIYEGGAFELGGKHLSLETPAYQRAGEVSLSFSRHVVLEAGGRRFPFGPGHSLPDIGNVPKYGFDKDPGDNVLLTVQQSRIAWPTPYETNFMTGYVASRKRNVYCRLRWTKLSGARLDMLWKTDQGYYLRDGGWVPPRIEGIAGGLIDVSIHEAIDLESAAAEYLKRVKGWSTKEYRLEDRGPSNDLSGEVFLALHSDDQSNTLPGAGRSVELLVGYKDRIVIREIGHQ